MRFPTSKQRTKPRRQLRERERLDHVVVGPAIQAGDTILERVLRGQNEHRELGLLGPEVAQHLEP